MGQAAGDAVDELLRHVRAASNRENQAALVEIDEVLQRVLVRRRVTRDLAKHLECDAGAGQPVQGFGVVDELGGPKGQQGGVRVVEKLRVCVLWDVRPGEIPAGSVFRYYYGDWPVGDGDS